jgi:hypothetical protein
MALGYSERLYKPAVQMQDFGHVNIRREFPIAALTFQDVPVIVVFADGKVDSMSQQERQNLYWALQSSAETAKLTGNIVLFWREQSGRTKFIAPPPQHSFFRIMKYEQLHAQMNGTLVLEQRP